MPRGIRLTVLALATLLVAGGAALLSARGEAVLIDLYAASRQFLCF